MDSFYIKNRPIPQSIVNSLGSTVQNNTINEHTNKKQDERVGQKSEVIRTHRFFKPKFRRIAIIRTRNSSVFKLADFVVDIGGVYWPTLNYYDHHQAGFNQNFYGKMKSTDRDYIILLSSAGLIYRDYGKEIIRNFADLHQVSLGYTPKSEERAVWDLHWEIYSDIIREIDAADNGIEMFRQGSQPRYYINTGLSSRVKRLNPSWNSFEQDRSKAFLLAMDTTEQDLVTQLNLRIKTVRPAYEMVKNAYDTRYTFHSSGEIFFLK